MAIFTILYVCMVPYWYQITTLGVVYIIVNFTTQCGEHRHTDISNFATLIHTQKKINTLCGDFYNTVW